VEHSLAGGSNIGLQTDIYRCERVKDSGKKVEGSEEGPSVTWDTKERDHKMLRWKYALVSVLTPRRGTAKMQER